MLKGVFIAQLKLERLLQTAQQVVNYPRLVEYTPQQKCVRFPLPLFGIHNEFLHK